MALVVALAPLVALAGGKERIAAEGTIGDQWMLADGVSLAAAEYPPHYLSTKADVCMAIGYRIAPDGKTSDFMVLDQWNSVDEQHEPLAGFWQAFASAGAGALAEWRFKPRPEVNDPVPTMTVATLTFAANPAADIAQLRGECRIKDLARSIKKARSARTADGNMLKQEQENRMIRQERARTEADLRRANGG
ncbi:MAG: hypothetical protein R3F22_03320 [Lysobacteraceae bacterium]